MNRGLLRGIGPEFVVPAWLGSNDPGRDGQTLVADSALQGGLRFAPTSRPSDVPGLQLWLVADALGLTDGATVATWSDLSGKGNDATPAAGCVGPTYKLSQINGKAVARFNGGQGGTITALQSALSAANKPYSVVAIIRLQGTGGGRYPIYGASASGGSYGRVDITTANWLMTAIFSATLLTALGTVGTAPAIVSATYDASGNASAWINGKLAGTNTNNVTLAASSRQIGGCTVDGNALFGDIAEYCEWNTLLTTAQRQTVENYLAAKYGLTLS